MRFFLIREIRLMGATKLTVEASTFRSYGAQAHPFFFVRNTPESATIPEHKCMVMQFLRAKLLFANLRCYY